MKKISILLFFICSLAKASNWEVVGVGSTVTVLVDSNSIVQIGKYRKAWVKYSFSGDQDGFGYTNFKKYRSDTTLEHFSCDERLSGTMQSTYYDGEMSTGQVVGGMNLKVNQIQFSEVAPDTIGESVLNFVCKKTDSKGKRGAV